MTQSNWEADKMLDVYIHDYLLKRKLHASAKAFMTEGKVATDPVAIDAPGGFLFEWWSVFWDIFIARTNEKHSDAAAAYIEAQQIKAREQQQIQMQQLQAMQQRNAQLQRRDPTHTPLNGSIAGMNSDGMLGQSSASVLALKMYEERMKQSTHSIDGEASPVMMDVNRMALLKSAANPQSTMTQGNPAGISAALQQIQAQTQINNNDGKSEGNMGANQKNLPVDPSTIYGQAILQSKSGLATSGMNQSVTGPLKGWPLSVSGLEQIRPGLGVQIQKPNLHAHSQFLLASHQQQVMAQAQAQGIMGNSSIYGDMDARRFCGLPRSGVSAKEAQSTRNEGSICSPVQSSSPKMKIAQMQQTSSQQQDQSQQQLQQNNRKRKQHSSGAANSAGTGNTVGPSPNSPPSTHTPGDGIATASSLKHVNSVPKSLMMYGPDGAAGLTSSSNLLDMEHFGDVGSLDDNVESFLSHDGDGRDLYGALKQSPTQPKMEPSNSKGFTFNEVSCIRTKSKVTCCHFSSDGKLVASAGHDKKAVIWDVEHLQKESTPEEHKYLITDIRFRPNSTQFMTASYDCSVRLWDAANPSFSLHAYTSHLSPIMSADFHPKKTDLFCFCDANNEIRYWNTNPFACTRISKGGTAQVRFQPRVGQFLAAASGEVVSIFDVESDRQAYSFEGHTKAVNYVCWDDTGDYLASVSQDSVKVWSMASGECIHELPSNDNEFHSCVFHPTYSTLLVIGGASSMELWNMTENKSMTVAAHDKIIAALAHSPVTGMVASASHDCSVKLWK